VDHINLNQTRTIGTRLPGSLFGLCGPVEVKDIAEITSDRDGGHSRHDSKRTAPNPLRKFSSLQSFSLTLTV